MPMPTFLVIGAAKCGTTSLCDLLGEHPDVFMSRPKEPHYFSKMTSFRRKRGWYESLFDSATGHLAVGEGSTSYTHPHRIDVVVPRIHRVLPDARLIYIVRHPVRRLESDWKMRLREGRALSSINSAVDRDASLITFGLYWKHLTQYLEHFREDQLLVLFLEEFAEHPERELARAFRHIGVDPTFTPETPEEPRNAADDLRRPGALVSIAKQVPGFNAAKDLLPPWSLRMLRIALTEEYVTEVDWDSETLDVVKDHFRDDAQRLLSYCERPADLWKL